jgi:RNA polymerase sigma-70 factor (ECF subfamily)
VRQQGLWHLRRRRVRARQLVCLNAEAPRRPPADRGTSADATDAAAVIALIGRLPEQEAVVVALRHLDDRPVAEISEITGRPAGTVTKQLSRAYARMRAWLEEGEVP